MKITQINTFDVIGGAARAAYRLHNGLKKAGCNSNMFVRFKYSNDDSVQKFERLHDIKSKVRRLLRRYSIKASYSFYNSCESNKYEPFSDDRTTDGLDILKQLPEGDLFHLHWVRKFINLPLFLNHVNAPIVLTLHDMNAFTGGCHYVSGCDRYTDSCGSCPQLNSMKKKDLSRRVWTRKKIAYNGNEKNIKVVSPSQWMAEKAKNSSLLEKIEIITIPNGIDTDIFKPRGIALRSVLNIPQNATVILFVAQKASNYRKGFNLLHKIFNEIKRKNIYLVSVGEKFTQFDFLKNHIHLGMISNDDLLSSIYSMCDFYVMPSLEDNFPNTILESLSCGTPVLGFNVGGINEMIIHKKNGLLADVGDKRALREAMYYLIDHVDERKTMRENSRRDVLDKFSLKIQAEKYIKLYNDIICR